MPNSRRIAQTERTVKEALNLTSRGVVGFHRVRKPYGREGGSVLLEEIVTAQQETLELARFNK
jgi:hypothetical protein